MEDDMNDNSQFREAELARLADGSLPAPREADLRAEVQRSPQLAQELAEQERAVAMLRSIDVHAPDSLRAAIEEQTRAPAVRGRARRPRLRLWTALPAAVAVAAVIAVISSGGSAAGGPSLQQTVHLTLAAAVYGPPSEVSGPAGPTLDDTSAGIPFPYWQDSVGWRAVGARVDRFSRRYVVTVFYSWHGNRVGYAIVGGAPVRVLGGVTVRRGGVAYTFLREGSARVVTWLRSGHTCVIAGHQVSNDMLLRLARA